MPDTIPCFLPCLVAGVFICASAGAQDDPQSQWEAFADGQTLTYSESLPISAVIDDFESDRYAPGGRAAFTYNRTLIGARRGGWEIAAIGRYDYDVEYTTDTADFVNARVNDGPLADGPVEIGLDIRQSRGAGLRVGYLWSPDPRLALGVYGQVFRADQGIDGGLFGTGTALNGDLDTGTAEIDYIYTSDLLLERDLGARTGTGTAIDLSAVLRPHVDLRIDAEILDALGRITWNRIDRTLADADLSTLTRDEAGLILVRPVLRGRNSVESDTQHLRTRYLGRVTWQAHPNWSISQGAQLVGSTWLATSGVDYYFGDWRVGPRVELTSGAVGIEAAGRTLFLRALSDSWAESSANYVEIGLGFRLGF